MIGRLFPEGQPCPSMQFYLPMNSNITSGCGYGGRASSNVYPEMAYPCKFTLPKHTYSMECRNVYIGTGAIQFSSTFFRKGEKL